MEAVAGELGEAASFFTVWVREAHAGGDYPQPESLAERERYAHDFREGEQASIPIVLDDMQGSLHRLFGNLPNAVYVIDGRGRVAYRASWADHREIRRVLDRLLETDRRMAERVYAGVPRWSEEVLRKLPEDPTQDVRTTFDVWESAGNYDEAERFFGDRAERMRAQYERLTGRAPRRAAVGDSGGGGGPDPRPGDPTEGVRS